MPPSDYMIDVDVPAFESGFEKFSDFNMWMNREDPFADYYIDVDILPTVSSTYDPYDSCDKYADDEGVEDEEEDDEEVMSIL